MWCRGVDSMGRPSKATINKRKTNAINEQIEKLKKLYIIRENSNSGSLILNLIEEASFMYVTLKELKEKIKTDGIKEKYKNGNNQWGYKDSVELKSYNSIIKNYTSVIKQLNDMLPEPKQKSPDDEFDEFNGIKR